MMARRSLLFVLLTLSLLLLAGVVVAQITAAETCPDLVVQALERVRNLCQGQGRNSACYGNDLVEAHLAATQPADLFDAPGDMAALVALTALRTAPLNEDLTEWGVSLLSVQANLPGTLPGHNAQFMLFGGAQIESAVAPEAVFASAALPVQANAALDTVLRNRPADQSPEVRAVRSGEVLQMDARSGDYVRAVIGDQFGWLRADQTTADSVAVQALPEYAEGQSFTPMQSFYLRTGIGRPVCAQAPSALVVQSPEGIRVDIRANGADINLGSTIILRTYSLEEAEQNGVFILGTADIGGLLEVSVIDGQAIVRQQDGTPVTINEGEQSFICLDKPASLGLDGRENDQTISYACGGWSIPERIRQRLRADFSLVDDYPMIYPVDIVTATPTTTRTPRPTLPANATPTAVTEAAPALPAANPLPSATPGPVTGSPALSVGASASLAPNSFVFELQAAVTNSGAAPATGLVVTGFMPRAGNAVAQISAGRFDSGSMAWIIGALAPGETATLRLTSLLALACGETVSGSVQVSSANAGGASAGYSATASCSAPPTATDSPPATDTPVPPTAIPPTTVPPTSVPATDAPPTSLPPTAEPPTAPPPTPEPPTAVPPTSEPPTLAPTPIPPTPAPPTPVPPTEVPPAATSEPTMTICHDRSQTLVLPESSALNHLSSHERDYAGPCSGDDEDDEDDEGDD